MPALDPAQQRDRVAQAPVARLATLRPDGTPRLVPVTFALVGEELVSAVDEVKPKRSTRLARLSDVARDPRVALLVDHYAPDWTTLWWVRVDGAARVDPDGTRYHPALRAKYPQYVSTPLGAVLVITPTAWAGWTAS